MSTFNEQEVWLTKAIESILNQTYSNLELIIICDNPENQIILELIEHYRLQDSRIVVLINEKNSGLAQSLNKGFKIARGKYVARMDADDISDLNRIEKQLKYMLENENVDLLSTNIVKIDENDLIIRKGINIPDNNDFIYRALKDVNVMNHPTWMMKKELFIKLNGYRNYLAAQDYDFLLRAKSFNVRFGFLNEHLLMYRERNNSISTSKTLYRIKLESEIKKNTKCNKNHLGDKIKCKYVESRLFDTSQKLMNKANYYRFKNRFINFAALFLISNLISIHQFKRTLSLIRLRFLLRRY